MANDIRKFQNVISGKADQIYDYTPNVSEIGDFVKVEGVNVLVNSIRNLLLTPLGFYPFDPTYGSLLYKKVFEPLDATSIEGIEFEVRQRIMYFDDRITISDVKTSIIGQDNKGVQIEVFIKKGEVTGTASVSFLNKPTQRSYLEG